jgi:hypothetical protein
VGGAQMEGRVAHRRESRMSYSQRAFDEARKSVKRHKRTRINVALSHPTKADEN